MLKVEGLHVLGELMESRNIINYPCSYYKKKISMIIKESGLNEVGSYYHSFEGGGFTGVIALCESHVSIHTWPEVSYVTIDVFTCNYSRDNSEAARLVFDKITALFKPKNIRRREIKR